MILKLDATEALRDVQCARKLIHHITNWVTINDCAQVVRHWGCLPVMAHAVEEVADMVKLAHALVLNIGTLTEPVVEAMVLAARAANEKGIPVVLDAVGAGATPYRTEKTQFLLSEARIDIVKGNAGEIASVAGVRAEVRGVESISVSENIIEVARKLAQSLNSIVVVTGSDDLVAVDDKVWIIRGGHETMGRVVGTGCISTSTIGCFVSLGKSFEEYFKLTAQALACFKLAGLKAAQTSTGVAFFINQLFNEIVNLSYEIDDLVFAVEQV